MSVGISREEGGFSYFLDSNKEKNRFQNEAWVECIVRSASWQRIKRLSL